MHNYLFIALGYCTYINIVNYANNDAATTELLVMPNIHAQISSHINLSTVLYIRSVKIVSGTLNWLYCGEYTEKLVVFTSTLVTALEG